VELTVVMYHYVRYIKDSFFKNIKGLEFELFKKQIDFLGKNFNFITAEDLINHLYDGKELPKKPLILTFDDGYIDHYLYVFPYLFSLGIQGSFFVPVKAISENKILDVNKIHFILDALNYNSEILMKELNHLIEKYKKDFNLFDFEYYYNAYAKANRFDDKNIVFVKKMLQVVLPENLRKDINNYLFEKYVGFSEEAFSKNLYMNREHLLVMLKNGMHIGSHGYDHFWYNSLDEDSQRMQIEISRKFLLDLGVDGKYLSFCYPYGAYNDKTIKILSELEFKIAYTTEVKSYDMSFEKRYLIPRFDTNDFLNF